jgi:hypothetical protein
MKLVEDIQELIKKAREKSRLGNQKGEHPMPGFEWDEEEGVYVPTKSHSNFIGNAIKNNDTMKKKGYR